MKQPNIWIHDVLDAFTGATTVSSATWLQALSGFSPSEARQPRDRVRRQERDSLFRAVCCHPEIRTIGATFLPPGMREAKRYFALEPFN